MIYVFPDKPRSPLVRVLMWPLVALQVYRLHRENGWRYAIHWANQSLRPES